jgi:glycosyltransferase involved in cell wall biosynthesis
MPTKICFVYMWATSGGVERVFLNRSEPLLRRYPKLEIEIYFYNDCGGVALMKSYIRARRLGERFRVTSTFDPSRYDAIFTVDTPQVVADYAVPEEKLFMECHTPYAENRVYLREWQNRLQTLIVPSGEFLRVIEDEWPALRGKVRIVRNFVPRLPQTDEPGPLPAWRGPVFLYFSRIDEHKNFTEFVEGLSWAREYCRQEPLGLVSGQIYPGYPVNETLEKNGVRGSVVVLPPVPFAKSHVLMRLLRARKAVFVSPSKGESFGLSAAEAMTAGLPVVLSDIPPHAALVDRRDRFLYPLGNVPELAMKMAAAIENYDEMSAECVALSAAFSEEAFLMDWEKLFPAGALGAL